MPDFLIRNLDDALMEKMRQRAAENGRSLQVEIKETLRSSVRSEQRREFLRKMDHYVEKAHERGPSDMTASIRHDRDTGHKPWHGY